MADGIACVASVSVRFRSKERGTRIKDCAKNGVSKRAGRGGITSGIELNLPLSNRSEQVSSSKRRASHIPVSAVKLLFLYGIDNFNETTK